MKLGNSIPLARLDHRLSLRENELPDITLSSPASSVLLDFTVFQPMSLAPGVSVDDAATAMQYSHTNLKLVADRDNFLLGIVSLRDINSVKVLSTASAMGISRSDLTVKDLMTTAQQLHCIKRDRLKQATVSDVVDLLEKEKQRFLLVLDREEQLTGLICAEEIARLLGKQLDTLPRANDFKEVFTALRK
ncbi:CBS domain-containing protein [Aestuariicella hydrocarbonica]|uniref:CBS domain-containing protein n=1 Tax=Pseudomaricurvus hydrocarbonicus TaxID=1470433 RepID=A0A9E5MNX9_9GAMM|nr:CBS domain-containing protein [Aestuariicella hydrocarbonica]NHO67746.1 CBS domain-containing protein [Aestuariicella hydrocarbonica]